MLNMVQKEVRILGQCMLIWVQADKYLITLTHWNVKKQMNERRERDTDAGMGLFPFLLPFLIYKGFSFIIW